MKRNRFFVFTATVLMFAAAMNVQAAPQTTAFTYQGQLTAGGILPSGQTFQFTFTLYDAATNGNVVGNPIQQAILVGSGGLFTTDLDFGQVFNGQQYWLEIKVGTTVLNEQALAARQPISAAPVAQYALKSPPQLLFLSSANQATVSTTVGGLTSMIAVLPLSGAVSAAYSTTLNGGILDLTPNGSPPPPPPQILPVNGTFGSISAQMFVTGGTLIPGGSIVVQAQLYTGNVFSGVMVPTPLMCVLAPSLTNFIPAGTSATCQVTGLTLPVIAGSSAVVVVSATGTGIPASVPMTVSVGVGP